MDLRQLRYFLALLEQRSFVRAAESTGISQPAFSRAIQGLEAELGCLLVDRASRDLRPTAQGQLLQQHALVLVQGADNLTRDIQRMGQLDAGQLAIGVGPLLGEELLPQVQLAFMQRYPKVNCRIEMAEAGRLSRALLRDELDFLLIDDVRPFEADPAFSVQPLTPRAGSFFCRQGHPLLAKESLSTNDLFAYPLIAPPLPAALRKALANLSGKVDVDLRLNCDSPSVLRELISQSEAVGFSSRAGLSAEVAAQRLCFLEPRNLSLGIAQVAFRAGILLRAGSRLTPAASAMFELIRDLDGE